VGRLREIAAPFVAAAPGGARVRTRLRVSPDDKTVLPGNPPPHEAPGRHPAPRPVRLTGPRQATRRAKTVRARRITRTSSCYLAEER